MCWTLETDMMEESGKKGYTKKREGYRGREDKSREAEGARSCSASQYVTGKKNLNRVCYYFISSCLVLQYLKLSILVVIFYIACGLILVFLGHKDLFGIYEAKYILVVLSYGVVRMVDAPCGVFWGTY